MAVSRRDFLKGTLGGALSISFQACGMRDLRKKPLNVLFIMTDQQPVSTLGCYGNPLDPTPNLDRLAATGIRFTNFYIGAFPCSPSRASIFTGCFPQKHGVFTNNIPLKDEIPSLGFLMRDHGRNTAYFGKSHLKGHMYRDMPWQNPFNGSWYYRRIPSETEFKTDTIQGGWGEDHSQLGFDTWAGGWKDYHMYLRKVGLGKLLEERPVPGNHNDLPSAPNSEHRYSLLPEEHHMASFFTQKAREFLRNQCGNTRPFCMVLSYYGPHLPVSPPKPWDKKYSLEQCPLPDNHRDTLEGKPNSQRSNDYCYKLPEWSENQFRDYMRRYYGYCAYLDSQIGRVLDALREYDFEDNTIVVFTSDHGDMIGSHGYLYKMENCAYQELCNVPFIMRVPGVTRPGSVTTGLVSSVDILPSLLELTGVRGGGTVHGNSFARLLYRPGRSFHDRIFIHWGPRSIVSFDGEWKFGLHANAEMDELYNHQQDPGEMENLVMDNKYTPVINEKKKEILDWLNDTGHPYAKMFQRKSKIT